MCSIHEFSGVRGSEHDTVDKNMHLLVMLILPSINLIEGSALCFNKSIEWLVA